jgi:protein-S-isoprenylcysteine O-methyltransferase Ste14
MNTIPLITALILVIITRTLDPILRFGNEAKSIAKTEKDKNSTILLGILNIINLLLLISGFLLNHATIYILFSKIFIPSFGILIMITGFYIRVIAIKTLKEYYTRTLKIQSSQKVVDTGMYKYVRHPGYIGSILQWLGAGIASNNLIVLVLITITTFIVYHYRIQSEEKMLVEGLGDKYKDYMNRTKRLIPGIY